VNGRKPGTPKKKAQQDCKKKSNQTETGKSDPPLEKIQATLRSDNSRPNAVGSCRKKTSERKKRNVDGKKDLQMPEQSADPRRGG